MLGISLKLVNTAAIFLVPLASLPLLSCRRETLALWSTEEVSIQQAQGVITRCTTLGSSCQRSSRASGNLCCCWKCHKVESWRTFSSGFSRSSDSQQSPEESKSCPLTAKTICVSVFGPTRSKVVCKTSSTVKMAKINSQNKSTRITSAE